MASIASHGWSRLTWRSASKLPSEAMNIFLKEFAEAYQQYRIILCLDGAGWHTSKNVALPENIQLLRLPPYSPELNPTEHILDYVRNKKNSIITHLNLLMLLMINWMMLCVIYKMKKNIVSSMGNFDWIILPTC